MLEGKFHRTSLIFYCYYYLFIFAIFFSLSFLYGIHCSFCCCCYTSPLLWLVRSHYIAAIITLLLKLLLLLMLLLNESVNGELSVCAFDWEFLGRKNYPARKDLPLTNSPTIGCCSVWLFNTYAKNHSFASIATFGKSKKNNKVLFINAINIILHICPTRKRNKRK